MANRHYNPFLGGYSGEDDQKGYTGSGNSGSDSEGSSAPQFISFFPDSAVQPSVSAGQAYIQDLGSYSR